MSPRRTGLAGLLLLAVTLLGAGPATAEEVEVKDITFATERDGLELRGAGILTYRVVFDVYAAALYLPPGAASSAVLEADTPKRLELAYRYAIEKEDFARAAWTVLSEQHEPEVLEALEPSVEELHDAFTAVEPGDRYTLTWKPEAEAPLRLALNGETRYRGDDPDLARAYFGIWLAADEPIDAGLRRDLLDE